MVEPVHSDSMATVYRAIRTDLRGGAGAVALKIIEGVATVDEDLAEAFDDEVRVARLMNHPNIARCVDTAVIGDVEHCRRKLQGFADVGVDRLMCLVQFGPL